MTPFAVIHRIQLGQITSKRDGMGREWNSIKSEVGTNRIGADDRNVGANESEILSIERIEKPD